MKVTVIYHTQMTAADVRSPERLRILYLHGVDPHAASIICEVHLPLLRARNAVLAPRMATGILSLRARNSVLRHIARQRLFRAVVLLALAGVASATGCVVAELPAAPPAAVLMPAVVVVGLVALVASVALSLRGALDDAIGGTLAVAQQALAHGRANGGVDVLVGQSWGGAVATLLIARGEWRGPTLLTAPGTVPLLLRSKRWGGLATLPAAYMREQMHVVVGDADGVAKTAELVAWCRQQDVGCEVLPACGHEIGRTEETKEVLLRAVRAVGALRGAAEPTSCDVGAYPLPDAAVATPGPECWPGRRVWCAERDVF